MSSQYVFKLSNMQGRYLAGAVDLRTIYGASLAHHKTGFRLLFRKRVFWNSQRQGVGSLPNFITALRRLESKIQLDMDRRHAAAEFYRQECLKQKGGYLLIEGKDGGQ